MAWMIVALLACDRAPSSSADTGEHDVCAEADPVTWEGFGEAFFATHCQPCHASTSTDRMGAPADVTFDTEDQVLALADRILRAATGDTPFMPPGGGEVTDAERAQLEIYLTCR